ncbi:hypothetical protein K445DRAFT_156323 [Daldinia sp. EC12]|nr:hypothetical protein K445DRAFT_156323 [Daldinia sp. EC12]
MERLPDETIVKIASFLPRNNLARYATLSRTWQRAIEWHTFSRLQVFNSGDDLAVFSRIVWANGMRRRFLKHLEFGINYGNGDETLTPSQQWQHFSEAIARDLGRLFRILAESDDKRGMTLNLQIEVGSNNPIDHQLIYPEPCFGLIGNGEHLAAVKCVSSLMLTWVTLPRLTLRTVVELAKRLPCLRSINLTTDQYHSFLEDRYGLANALVDAGSLLSTECLEVSLSLEQTDPHRFDSESSSFNAWIVLNTMVPDTTTSRLYDPLGAAIRMWSHNLVYLNISGIFDSSLFWPSKNEQSETTVTPWPRLKEFYVNLALPTPARHWYFVEQPGRPGRRNVPCEDTMGPLFEAWAKALECMPALKQASIGFQVVRQSRFGYPHSYPWSVILQAPDATPSSSLGPWTKNLKPYLHNSKLIFQATLGWRPERPTMRKLQATLNSRFPDRKMVELEVDFEGRVSDANANRTGLTLFAL